jgi:hypothetical protein
MGSSRGWWSDPNMKRGIHFLPISTIKIDQRQRKEPCDLASLTNNIKNRSLNP